MDVSLYNTFSATFWFSSLSCFMVDMIYPSARVNGNTIRHEDIITDYIDMIPLVLLNLWIAYPFFLITQHYLSCETQNSLPVPVNMALWIVGVDIGFYITHRIFHHKLLYVYHKIHHKYKYTYGIGAIYAHPVEFYLANLVPVAFPMIIFKMPILLCDWIVFFSTFYTIVISHGGFNIKLGESHLTHHLKFKYNYGLFKMDRLMDTKYISVDQSTSSTFVEVASTEDVAVASGEDVAVDAV